jgi:hypothetical protein
MWSHLKYLPKMSKKIIMKNTKNDLIRCKQNASSNYSTYYILHMVSKKTVGKHKCERKYIVFLLVGIGTAHKFAII